MGKVIAEFTMSLDGFIAGPNDEIGPLFRWYSSGDTEFSMGNGPTFTIARQSADLLRENWGRLGAIVTGRRDFEVSEAWGGQPPFPVPTYIVTHSAPQEWLKPGSPFIFITEGVPHAIAQAQQAAGDKVVGVGGTTITQQCLQAGLLDEIHIHLAPILLGEGIRLFDRLGPSAIDLVKLRVVDTPAVTHIQYQVAK